MLTEELAGALLDYWVAKAEGICLHEKTRTECGNWGTDFVCVECGQDTYGKLDKHSWKPSTNWTQGGPIIEREGIQISPPEAMMHVNGGPNAGWQQTGAWHSTIFRKGVQRRSVQRHETSPLICAMRAYVASKYGEQVDNIQEPT